MTDTFSFVSIDFSNDCSHCRRTCRWFDKFDIGLRIDISALFLDNRAKTLNHHIRWLVSMMFFGEIDDHFGDVFTVFKVASFDQSGKIKRRTCSQEYFSVKSFRLFLEYIDNTFTNMAGLLNGTAVCQIEINGIGIVVFPWQHFCQNQFGWDKGNRKDKSKECCPEDFFLFGRRIECIN